MCSIMINFSVGGDSSTPKMAAAGPVSKVTTGHICRIMLGITSVILLLPYMVLKHGPLDSSLIREVFNPKLNSSHSAGRLSIRHLQAIVGTKTDTKQSRMENLLSSTHQNTLIDPFSGTDKKRTAIRPPLLPLSVRKSLQFSNKTGYLIGNISQLEFKEYQSQDVDLRIIVLAYNRGDSLLKCLNSLNSVDFSNSTISLHVWIDRDNATSSVDNHTYHIARSFTFHHGAYQVHIQRNHVGILSQWLNVWRPNVNTNEIALILEDDMTVSKHFWRWLRPVHSAYSNLSDISGFGLSHPGMEHMHATYLDIPAKFNIYMYRVICTWGFSPHTNSWRQFQDWFYQTETNSSFLPLVPNILPSQWFLGELKHGQERNLWEMWHICFSHFHNPPQYTVMLNTAQEGLLAVNRHEAGLHDKGTARTDPLCEVWREEYGVFPQTLPKFGYDGQLDNTKEMESLMSGEDDYDSDEEYQIAEVTEWTGR